MDRPTQGWVSIGSQLGLHWNMKNHHGMVCVILCNIWQNYTILMHHSVSVRHFDCSMSIIVQLCNISFFFFFFLFLSFSFPASHVSSSPCPKLTMGTQPFQQRPYYPSPQLWYIPTEAVLSLPIAVTHNSVTQTTYTCWIYVTMLPVDTSWQEMAHVIHTTCGVVHSYYVPGHSIEPLCV